MLDEAVEVMQRRNVTPDRKATIPPMAERAYAQFDAAMSHAANLGVALRTDRQAFEHYYEHLAEDEERKVKPDFESWDRNVRTARKSKGTSKNQPRGGRVGRNVVRPEDIETPIRDEWSR